MDYTTVTPRLHVGKELPFEHVATRDQHDAAARIEEGQTVLVPSFTCAIRVQRLLGLPEPEISERINFAMTGDVELAV